MVISFFFQAEDGIRDGTVTGVQTCALPICWPNVAHALFWTNWRPHAHQRLTRSYGAESLSGSCSGSPQLAVRRRRPELAKKTTEIRTLGRNSGDFVIRAARLLSGSAVHLRGD